MVLVKIILWFSMHRIGKYSIWKKIKLVQIVDTYVIVLKQITKVVNAKTVIVHNSTKINR